MYKWRSKIRCDGSESIMLPKHSDTYSSGSQTPQLKGQLRSIYPGLASHSPSASHESHLPCKSSQIFCFRHVPSAKQIWLSSSCEKDPRIVPNKTTGHKIAAFPALMVYRLLVFVWSTDFRLSTYYLMMNQWPKGLHEEQVKRTFEISYILVAVGGVHIHTVAAMPFDQKNLTAFLNLILVEVR